MDKCSREQVPDGIKKGVMKGEIVRAASSLLRVREIRAASFAGPQNKALRTLGTHRPMTEKLVADAFVLGQVANGEVRRRSILAAEYVSLEVDAQHAGIGSIAVVANLTGGRMVNKSPQQIQNSPFDSRP